MPYSNGCWQEASASPCTDLFLGCFLGSWLHPEQATREITSRSCNVLNNLVMEATHHHFCTILLVSQASPIQCVRKHKVCFQRLGPLGAILETTPSLYFFSIVLIPPNMPCHLPISDVNFWSPYARYKILEGGDFHLF